MVRAIVEVPLAGLFLPRPVILKVWSSNPSFGQEGTDRNDGS